MLCFLFAALIVVLDQFFKHWILRTLELGETGPVLIPGILGLTRWENDGAMLNILSGQQWLLAAIAFVAVVVLIMIILRYNEGFWGTLGLSAALGGAIGNLIDRVFNEGRVIDMFETLFIKFPIFNIADMFITLGFITFIIHFIVVTIRGEKKEQVTVDAVTNDSPIENGEAAYDEFPEIDTIAPAQTEQDAVYSTAQYPSAAPNAHETQFSPDSQYSPIPQYPEMQPLEAMTSDYEPITDTTTDTSFSLDAIEADFESLDDYSVDDLLREYGIEDDE